MIFATVPTPVVYVKVRDNPTVLSMKHITITLLQHGKLSKIQCLIAQLSQFIELEGIVLENVYGTEEEKSKLIKRGKRKMKKNFQESEGYQTKSAENELEEEKAIVLHVIQVNVIMCVDVHTFR